MAKTKVKSNLTDNEKLKLLYESYLTAVEKNRIKRGKSKFLISGNENVYEQFYLSFIQIYGFDGFPKILPDKEYKNLDSSEFYHGFVKFKHGLSFLQDKVCYIGAGQFKGLLSTTNYKESKTYTLSEDGKKHDAEKVLKFKVIGENYVPLEDIEELRDVISLGIVPDDMPEPFDKKLTELFEFISKIRDIEKREGFKQAVLTHSLLAAYLGFDYINVPRKTGSWPLILNRRVVAVSESELKRFKNKNKLEKDNGESAQARQ